MKVIEQIIDYLHSEEVISDEDFEVLKSKGFYPNYKSDDYDYYDYDYESNWSDEPETKDWDETYIDKLRKFKTKRSPFKGTKNRFKANKLIENQVNLNLDHLWVNIKNDIDYESFINQRELLDFLKMEDSNFYHHYRFIAIENKINLKVKYSYLGYWEFFHEKFGLEKLIYWSDKIINKFLIEENKSKLVDFQEITFRTYIKPKHYFGIYHNFQIENDKCLKLNLNKFTQLNLTNSNGEKFIKKINLKK